MAHTHHRHAGHDDGPPVTALTTRRILVAAVAACVAASLVGLVVLWPDRESLGAAEALGFGERVDAQVVRADVEPCSYDPLETCDLVTFEVTSGPPAGEVAVIETSLADAITLRPGDEVVLNYAPDAPAEAGRFSFADYQRTTPLVVLTIVFAAAVIALGRVKGLLALVGLGCSLAVLVGFVLPALLDGRSPVGVALTGGAVISLVALYLAHGPSEKTSVAVLGMIASLAVTFVLAQLFSGATRLTGLASEESITLLAFAPDLDFRGILLAATIIGTLGVLDDVTITQVSAVWELHRADTAMGARRLYAAAVRIGRDHIASTVNTLVLVYAAAALPLLLIFTQSGLGLGTVLTIETVAAEIVQTLVGSVGLVASVPITTALAVLVVTRQVEES